MKPTVIAWFFYLIVFAPGSARAEYRVYTLQITDTQTGQTRSVFTTLDHVQYPDYFPVHRFETVAIAQTWMCWGRHGAGQKACGNPRAVAKPGLVLK